MKVSSSAGTLEAVQDARIYIELNNRRSCELSASTQDRGLNHAIAKGWLWKHEAGTYAKFTQAGAELFA
jgi:hypothetical protein